ncbi:methyltransferase-like protein 6 [Artemisia annua]|uniref:Methyltransferase-like protein 6 n=1 Tax=Artemisia annua TaxID=35608 RepID=A0A2U1KZA2_ARTAN|nr:methyltransferase-like protein 6 [Artemisia annua]
MAVCFPAISISPSFLPSVIAMRSRRCLSAIKLASDDDVTQYVNESRKHWDNFYECPQNKDRHYLEKDWGQYFHEENDILPSNGKTILEAGSGTGNTIFPLAKKFPQLFVHACDFSHQAVTLVKSHTDFREDQMNVFVCNIAEDDLCDHITPASVDIVTLVFTLSAVSPEKMPIVLQHIGRVLKPNGYVLLRDYAIGDYAQAMLMNKNQVISENFYFRGDGTCCSFYFSEDLLSELFVSAGFTVVDVNTYNREIENRAKNITMQRLCHLPILNHSYCSTLGVGYEQFSDVLDHNIIPLSKTTHRQF